MNHKTQDIIAVDVAKETLSVRLIDEAMEVPNSTKGFRQIAGKISRKQSTLVVCEATGGYERKMVRSLQHEGIRVHVANPATVRSYAKGKGIRVKSDPIDARILLSYASDNQLDPTRKPTESEEALVALLDRRAHLSRELTRERNRREKEAPHIKDFIDEAISFIEKQIKQIDGRIKEIAEAEEELRQQRDRLSSIKGVGELTALTVCAYLPELANITRNQAVALAGLAPFDRDSGKSNGRRFIHGGRAKIRRCLYMAAVSAARFNPVIRDYVQRLTSQGKPFKCAIVAAMRKILICMQSLLKKPDFIPSELSNNEPISA